MKALWALVKAVPLWFWALAACVLVIGIQGVKIANLRSDLATARQEFTDYKLDAEQAARDEENRRRAAADQQTRKDAQDEADRTRDTVAAGAERERLFNEVERQRRLLAGRQATDAAGFAAERQARQRAYNLLANVYQQSVQRNGELAAEADRARARGLSCEARYNSLNSITR